MYKMNLKKQTYGLNVDLHVYVAKKLHLTLTFNSKKDLFAVKAKHLSLNFFPYIHVCFKVRINCFPPFCKTMIINCFPKYSVFWPQLNSEMWYFLGRNYVLSNVR